MLYSIYIAYYTSKHKQKSRIVLYLCKSLLPKEAQKKDVRIIPNEPIFVILTLSDCRFNCCHMRYVTFHLFQSYKPLGDSESKQCRGKGPQVGGLSMARTRPTILFQSTSGRWTTSALSSSTSHTPSPPCSSLPQLSHTLHSQGRTILD